MAARKILRNVCKTCLKKDSLKNDLEEWLDRNFKDANKSYNSYLYNETDSSVLKVKPVPIAYAENGEDVPGRQILRENWDKLFSKYPLLVTFGEDTGKIGGVNQSLEGLQKKYGELRITDTGIRETTILGQGIGLALRGMRPVVEIQYLDYMMYALQTLSDDLASTHYRTAGSMRAPVIISTRGHRLEGIWHSGSPVSMLINSVRGVYVCVPRDMTRASGFYNTLLEGSDPAVVIEPLNGYRLKEKMPSNIGEFKVALGQPEVIKEGKDLTVVTYGSMCKIVMDASEDLHQMGIDIEVIDVQTLLPFDINHRIVESLKKTNKILFTDEDVPGGATAYMMQQVIEEQKGYYYLDVEPATLAGKAHRPAYSSDGDYFSKPSVDDVVEKVYALMHDSDSQRFPKIF